MARSGPLLTEAQWKKIAPLLPKPPKHRQGGRPWIESRRVLEGILWILRSGARWQDLPEKYPQPSTCWRRLRDWDEQGVWLNIWRAFLSELNERQQLNWSESFLDGSFAPAKKGAAGSEKPSGARGRSGWWWSTARVFLWETPSLCIPGGSPPRGDDARGDPRRSASPCRPTAAEAGARDCRQSLRQRSAAQAVATARNRTDLPAQEESRSSGHAGWSRAAAVSAPLDRRAYHRLVGELPALGCAL